MKASKRTVRFYFFINDGWVKLTVTEGKTLSITRGGPTDEGYSYEKNSFWIEDDVLVRQRSVNSSDCDGRHGDYSTYECKLNDIPNGYRRKLFEWTEWCGSKSYNPVYQIEWARKGGEIYDQYAQMAGY